MSPNLLFHYKTTAGPGFGFHVWRNATAMMGIRRGGRDDTYFHGMCVFFGTKNPRLM